MKTRIELLLSIVLVSTFAVPAQQPQPQPQPQPATSPAAQPATSPAATVPETRSP